MTFIDDQTRLCWIYLMNKKSDVEKLFKDLYTFIENQFHHVNDENIGNLIFHI